jgi:hypothetical protein
LDDGDYVFVQIIVVIGIVADSAEPCGVPDSVVQSVQPTQKLPEHENAQHQQDQNGCYQCKLNYRLSMPFPLHRYPTLSGLRALCHILSTPSMTVVT